MDRRDVLACVPAVGLGWSPGARAQGFPERPVVIVVGAAPGGLQDAVARALADELAGLLGVQVIVENRGGHAGLLAMAAVRSAVPDGHTLLLAGPEVAALWIGNGDKPALEAIGVLATAPIVLAVPAASRIDTLSALLDPGPPRTLQVAAPGYLHMAILARLRARSTARLQLAGPRDAHVGAMSDGRVDLGMFTAAGVRQQLASGALRALASTSDPGAGWKAGARFPLVDGRDLNLDQFYGLYGPLGTSAVARDRLSGVLRQAMRRETWMSRLQQQGLRSGSGDAVSLSAAIARTIALVPDPCKISSECARDDECPKPCPTS